MKIRKQVYDLTLTDLEEYPVWEFALDEEGEEDQDEETVRPYRFTPPLDPNEGLMVVQAKFTLADSTKMKGYLTPKGEWANALNSENDNDKEDIGTFQPSIITDQGQIYFWYGMVAPTQYRISQYYHMLGKSPSQVFPLKFGSLVEMRSGPVEGTLDGFLYYDPPTSRSIKKVR